MRDFWFPVRIEKSGVSGGAIQTEDGSVGVTLSHHLKRLVDTGLDTPEWFVKMLLCCAIYSPMQVLIG